MGLKVWIDREQSRERFVVHVEPPTLPLLEAVFTYEPVSGGVITLAGVAVGPRAGVAAGGAQPLTVTAIRDMPMATWERAAQAAVQQVLDDVVAKVARSRSATAKALLQSVREAMPELAELPDFHPRVQSALHLAEVAQEYRRNLAAGLPDPVKEIARQHDVKPATARSWIHRARKSGFLNPAVGRTAGERIERG